MGKQAALYFYTDGVSVPRSRSVTYTGLGTDKACREGPGEGHCQAQVCEEPTYECLPK